MAQVRQEIMERFQIEMVVYFLVSETLQVFGASRQRFRFLQVSLKEGAFRGHAKKDCDEKSG